MYVRSCVRNSPLTDPCCDHLSPNRLDLITQINEIEARQEEYPETIAFVTLLNALISPHLTISGLGDAPLPAATAAAAAAAAATASPGAAMIPMPPLADGGADLEHFTAFVMHHVLGHLSQRGYRVAAQVGGRQSSIGAIGPDYQINYLSQTRYRHSHSHNPCTPVLHGTRASSLDHACITHGLEI